MSAPVPVFVDCLEEDGAHRPGRSGDRGGRARGHRHGRRAGAPSTPSVRHGLPSRRSPTATARRGRRRLSGTRCALQGQPCGSLGVAAALPASTRARTWERSATAARSRPQAPSWPRRLRLLRNHGQTDKHTHTVDRLLRPAAQPAGGAAERQAPSPGRLERTAAGCRRPLRARTSEGSGGCGR